MEDVKDTLQYAEFANEAGHDVNIYQRRFSRLKNLLILTRLLAESWIAKYIPGGYSESRCLKLRGRPMLYAILAIAGTAILFFGYDASVMSQVNTNPDYLRLMGANHGTDRDSAAVGGIVSVWFAGFAIGITSCLLPEARTK
jgi:hypothetical protein